MGKIHAGVSERFNIELWSIRRQKLLEFTSSIKINNEKPALPDLTDKWAKHHRESVSAEN